MQQKHSREARYAGKYPFLMESEGSLSCSQEPATGPYPEQDESTTHLSSLLFNIHFNIILPFMEKSSKWFEPPLVSQEGLASMKLAIWRKR
jgi:hypothetical protein